MAGVPLWAAAEGDVIFSAMPYLQLMGDHPLPPYMLPTAHNQQGGIEFFLLVGPLSVLFRQLCGRLITT